MNSRKKTSFKLSTLKVKFSQVMILKLWSHGHTKSLSKRPPNSPDRDSFGKRLLKGPKSSMLWAPWATGSRLKILNSRKEQERLNSVIVAGKHHGQYQHANECIRLCTNKSLFIKADRGQDVALGPWTTDTRNRAMQPFLEVYVAVQSHLNHPFPKFSKQVSLRACHTFTINLLKFLMRKVLETLPDELRWPPLFLH